MRRGICQCGRSESRIQDGELRVPPSVLQQGELPGKPFGIRDGVQHRGMGACRTQPMSAREERFDPESGGQLEE